MRRAVLALAVALVAGCADVEVVSVASDGSQGNNPASSPACSADGRWVVFASSASNLVEDDSNLTTDLFLRDLRDGTTTLLTRGFDGGPADGPSGAPSISADGRYIAFESGATNLVPGDENGVRDVFLLDRVAPSITLMSVGPGGIQGERDSGSPRVAANAPVVTFATRSRNLGASSPYGSDWFARGLDTNETLLLLGFEVYDGFGPERASGAAPSPDGSVALITQAECVLSWAGCGVWFGAIGIVDRSDGSFQPLTLVPDGLLAAQTDAPMWVGSDGRRIAFRSGGGQFTSLPARGLYLYDLVGGALELVSRTSTGEAIAGGIFDFAFSADGRHVAFTTDDPNVVSPDGNDTSDVFTRDRTSGVTVRVSEAGPEAGANGASRDACIDASGRSIFFGTEAFNLSAKDRNGFGDVLRAPNPLLD